MTEVHIDIVSGEDDSSGRAADKKHEAANPLRVPAPQTQFGERLASLMSGRGFSLREVARRAGISAGYLSNIRQGRKFPAEYTARRLDDVLDAGGELKELAQAHEDGKPERAKIGVPAREPVSREPASMEGISLSLPYVPCRVVIEISARASDAGNVEQESSLRLIPVVGRKP